jgi:hypothetical protein
MERIPLTDQDVAYLVGRAGATRIRLERFSGARLSIDRDVAEVEGNPEERALAKLAISITLQQRNGGKVMTDFEELEDRDDVSTFDVPKETVGFLLGAKGQTLRQMETNHRVFMFFDNERVRTSKHVRRRAPPDAAHACAPTPLLPPPPPPPLRANARYAGYEAFAFVAASRFLPFPTFFPFAPLPLRRFTASPLHRFAASPLRRFALCASPLRRFALLRRHVCPRRRPRASHMPPQTLSPPS